MCGIVGLQLKNPDLYPQLGELVVPMLDVLASRGPDSTGVAIYRHDVPPGSRSTRCARPTHDYDWAGFVSALEAAAGAVPVELRRRGRDAVSSPDRSRARAGPAGRRSIRVRLFGYGTAIEVYKDVGPAAEVCARYGVAGMAGYQAIGHTRMATESAVTTEHSHPFAVPPTWRWCTTGRSRTTPASAGTGRRRRPLRHRQRLRGGRALHRQGDGRWRGSRRTRCAA